MSQNKKNTMAYYFDYLSPYAYFSWVELKKLLSEFELSITLNPIPYPVITTHWGLKGIATIPPKKAFVYQDALRYSQLMKIPLNKPPSHPFKPFLPLRMSLFEVSAEVQFEVIDALWEACWVKQVDMSVSDKIVGFLNEKGLPGDDLYYQASREDVKSLFKKKVVQALDKGVFGVPTMILNQELFWGRDQFIYIKKILEGNDPLNNVSLTEMTLPIASWR